MIRLQPETGVLRTMSEIQSCPLEKAYHYDEFCV